VFAIVITWLLAIILGLLPIFEIIPGDRYQVHPVGLTLSVVMEEHSLYVYITLASFLALWTLTTLSYVVHRKKAENRHKEMVSQSKLQNHPSFVKKWKDKESERQLSQNIVAVIIAFTICYIPFAVTQSFGKSKKIHFDRYPESFDSDRNYIFNAFLFVSCRIVIINSFLNCIIYSVNNRQFRGAARKLFSRSYDRIAHKLTY